MRIAKIETAEVDIPLVTPFKTALRTVNSVNDIVVRVTADDGRTGFGEAPPTAVITGDTKGSIRCAIEEFIAPNLIGMEIDNLDGMMKKLHGCMVKNTSAKAAVDMALYDLYAQSCRAFVPGSGRQQDRSGDGSDHQCQRCGRDGGGQLKGG